MGKSVIGLLGGTFDPVHLGHLIMGRFLLEARNMDELRFLPAWLPPHKQDWVLTDYQHRVAMLELVVAGEPRLSVDDLESRREGPSFTIDSVDLVSADCPNAQICWIIGSDSLSDLHRWHRIAELVDKCQIITACRPGSTLAPPDALRQVLSASQLQKLVAGMIETPLIDISSTAIRERVVAGQSIRYFVPDAISQYISDHQLYREEIKHGIE